MTFKVGDSVVGSVKHLFPHRRGATGVIESIVGDLIYVCWGGGLRPQLTYEKELDLKGDKMTISTDKEYTTRDGLPVRIYAVDGGGDFPVHAAFFKGNRWHMWPYKANGQYDITDPTNKDLIEAPKTVERWVLVYPDGFVDSNLYESEHDALEYTTITRAIKITIPLEGE